MLVLTRKTEETIQIGGNITVKVLRVKGHAVQLGIEAPQGVLIVRGELAGRLTKPPKREENREPAQPAEGAPASNTGGRPDDGSGRGPEGGPSLTRQERSGVAGWPSCRLQSGRHAPPDRAATLQCLTRRAGPAAIAP
jgi:carbon storage regulator